MRISFKTACIIAISITLLGFVAHVIWTMRRSQHRQDGDRVHSLMHSEMAESALKTKEDNNKRAERIPSVILLTTNDFSQSTSEASARLSSSIYFRRLIDGETILLDDVSEPIRNAVIRLNSIILPRLQYNQMEIIKVLQYLQNIQYMKPPDRRHSMGLIHEDKMLDEGKGLEVEDKHEGALFEKLSLDTLLDCSLRRVLLLELIEQLYLSAQIDIGFSQEGNYMFGHAGEWASSNTPVYLLEFTVE